MKYEHIFEKIYRETHFLEQQKLTNEEIITKAKKFHPEYDYSKINYISSNKPVLVGCNKHGYFLIPPTILVNGGGCKLCTENLTNKEIIENAKKFHPEYDYSKVRYKDCNTYIKVGCKKHGDFSILPIPLMSGDGCSVCNKEMKLIEKARKFHPEYDYSKLKYVDTNTPVLIGCPKHGWVPVHPQSLARGGGCMKCAAEKKGIYLVPLDKRITNEKIIKKAMKFHPEYDYSKLNYINRDTPVLIGCPKHGFVPTSVKSIMNGGGCPTCSESKGEQAVRGWLEEHNINYIRQHRFADLKRYPYDFYLPDFNLLIEYNGEQHYEEKSDFFHKNPGSFEGQLKRDYIKKEYAEKNGIELLVIPYWEFKNIDKILSIKLL